MGAEFRVVLLLISFISMAFTAYQVGKSDGYDAGRTNGYWRGRSDGYQQGWDACRGSLLKADDTDKEE